MVSFKPANRRMRPPSNDLQSRVDREMQNWINGLSEVEKTLLKFHNTSKKALGIKRNRRRPR